MVWVLKTPVRSKLLRSEGRMACNRQPRRMGYSATEARFRLELDQYLACLGPHNAGLAMQQFAVI